jgi:hypothetical protein
METNMKYVTETVTPLNGGRERREGHVDLERFATNFAKAIGGRLIPADDMDAKTHRTITLGAEIISLSVPSYGPAAKMKVTFTIRAPDVKHDERNFHDKKHKTEEATVSPDSRTIEAIANDVKRRVIEASKPALAAQRAYAQDIRDSRASIVTIADSLKRRMPMLDVRVNEQERRASVYGGKGHYVDACLSADGSVNVQRLGSMSLVQFEAVMKLLNK